MLTPPAPIFLRRRSGLVFYMNRIFVIIDGSNLYHKFKDVQLSIKNTANYDYGSFCRWLANGGDLRIATYYVGVVRSKPGDSIGLELRKKQNYFILIVNQLNDASV